jgi:hypothetical protein
VRKPREFRADHQQHGAERGGDDPLGRPVRAAQQLFDCASGIVAEQPRNCAKI